MVNVKKTFGPAYCVDHKPSWMVRLSCLMISSLFYLTPAINTANAATYYISLTGSGTHDGSSSGNAFNLSEARDHSIKHPEEEITFLLASGNYGRYWESVTSNVGGTGIELTVVNRTAWHSWKANTGATVVFDSIRFYQPSQNVNAHIRFDDINVTIPMPAYDPGDPPWSDTLNCISIVGADYVEALNSNLSGANKYLTPYGFSIYNSDNVMIYHCNISSTQGGGLVSGCSNFYFQYNHVHGISELGGIQILGDSQGTLIEGNHIHDMSYNVLEDYFPPDKLIDGLDTYSGDPAFIDEETVTQGTKTGILKSIKEEGGHKVFYIVATGLDFLIGEQVVGDTSGATFTPDDRVIGYHGGSGLSIRNGNITIRNNIIHDHFSQSIYFYPEGIGYSDIIIENNLVYDSGRVGIYDINGTCIIRNNTLIGYVDIDSMARSNVPQRYMGGPSGAGITIDFYENFNGTGFTFYNNIVVGPFALPNPYDSNVNKYDADYNMWWSRWSADDSTWINEAKGDNSQVAVWREGAPSYSLHGWPNYFENIGYTDPTNEWNPSTGVCDFFIDPYFFYGDVRVPADSEKDYQDRGVLGDYHLATDSPAINFGDADNQPSDSLGTIGPDGFIRNEGQPRDANHHSVGCYEYISSDPNNPPPELQAIGDKSVDENVTLTFDVNATDPNNEPITYSAQGLPTGATLDPQTGEFAWTPSYTQAGSYQVTFRASDGNSWDSEIITITINNVNRPPVIGSIADQSIDENSLLSFSVNASDPDGQALTYSVTGLPAGAVFASQTLTWTPSYDQAGSFAVTFTVDDGLAQDSQPITITVINVNRTPVLATIGNQSVWADDPLTFTIDATDPDGDTVTYSAANLPSGATFATQTFDWTPSQGQMGSYDVTFLASDGQLQDSEIVTITVDVDSLAPTVTNLSPAVGAIQVPLNNLITLDVTDAGKGIEPASVKIKVKVNSNPNNNTVYFGDTDYYTSPYGDCRRIGSNADYKFVYQATNEMFYYDQMVTITVNATDLAGNVMNEYSYSFATEMHSFGQNKQVNSGLDNNDRPVTVCDSSGNIWTAWHAGSIGNRDIYVSKLTSGEENFGGTFQLTDNTNDQCNPALALDSNDKLYVVWQDNREGDWDIYLSTSVDGISWSTETRINDPNNGNQVNPAIAIDGLSPNQAHVVWQDDLAGNQDICIAASSDGFATKTISQITTDSFDQVEPAVTADSANTIYVVWTDGRNGSNDIYGAASNNPWTNVAIVSNANNQSSPVIAAESTGSILHFLWVDDTLSDNDIYYTSSSGLPGSPLTDSSIIDDSSGADQLEPAIAVTGSTGNDLKVFACWQDWRNTDTDLYFAELSSGSGTNVFVGDGGSSTYQGEPIIGIDEYSHPYLIWADNRSTNTEIYYAGSTFVEPVELASELVAASAPSSTTVGADPQAITTVEDVSVVVPAGACSYDVDITVTKIANPQTFAAPCLGSYDFGPSGIQFSQPVTITIPYSVSEANGSTLPYWYNSLTGTLSQQGITNIQDIVISPTLHALSFETTHFTAFYLLGGGAGVLGGGGGGGCSLSAGGEGNMVEFVLPYIGLVAVMAILKVRDARERKARTRNMTAGKI